MSRKFSNHYFNEETKNNKIFFNDVCNFCNWITVKLLLGKYNTLLFVLHGRETKTMNNLQIRKK